MKLRYRNTIDDLVAFARFYLQRSPLLKQQARATAVLLSLLLLAGMAIISLSPRDGASTISDRLFGLVACLGPTIVPFLIIIYFVGTVRVPGQYLFCLSTRNALQRMQQHSKNLSTQSR